MTKLEILRFSLDDIGKCKLASVPFGQGYSELND
jgi:hypothetical protein